MVKLYNDDCLKVIDNLIEQGIKVDAIITDPPFNLVEKSGGNIHLFNQDIKEGRNIITAVTMKYDIGFNQTLWIEKISKVVKKGGNVVIFNDWENMGEIAKTLRSNGFNVKQMGHWKKTNPLPSEWKRRIVSGKEYFLHSIKKGESHTFNVDNVWDGEIIGSLTSQKEKKYGKHPNQKPIYLMEKLIKVFTNENDIVLDLFMGSGSTGIACVRNNRQFIGVELDKTYFELSQERINKEQNENNK